MLWWALRECVDSVGGVASVVGGVGEGAATGPAGTGRCSDPPDCDCASVGKPKVVQANATARAVETRAASFVMATPPTANLYPTVVRPPEGIPIHSGFISRIT